MRIAMISPLEMRVPPMGYGGTELVVSLLTDELVSRGHDVTLFASGDSVTKAKLVAGCDHFLRDSGRNGTLLTGMNAARCLEQSENFDVIHNHTTFEGMVMAGLIKTPMITTLHGGLSGDWLELFSRYRGWYNTISFSAKSLLPAKERFAGVIHNAIDVESYPFNGARRDLVLLFLSRISREKGPHIAIKVAKSLGCRLVIAGNVHKVDKEFFLTEVMPGIDGDQIKYIGEADNQLKRELFSQAYCLLAPITWDEPFGLFYIEAMACGTPVVTFRRGSAPEVIKHGETGFVVDSIDEMVNSISKVGEINPSTCRKHVLENFTVSRMVTDYVSAYKLMLHAEAEKLTIISPDKDSARLEVLK